MKKLSLLLLIALTAMALCACSADAAEELAKGVGSLVSQMQTGTPSGGDGNPDELNSITDRLTDTSALDGLSEADKQKLMEEAEKEGVDLTFDKDGQMVYKDEDGTVVQQNDDGSWSAVGADGETAQFGGDWPDNEFTRLIPKPSFSLTAASSDSQQFSVAFVGADAEIIRQYAQQVKKSGFDKDVAEEGQNLFGIAVYNFSASDGKGHRIEIFTAAGVSGLTLTKE